MWWMIRSLAVMMLFFMLISLDAGLTSTPAFAQTKTTSESKDLKDDIDSIKTDLAEIKSELKALRQLLVERLARPSPRAPVVAKVSLAGNPILGKSDAPLTLIEFSDYQCPFCKKFFQTTLPTLKAEYVETGKVRYVFRDFPLDQIHPQARKAAEAAHCAGEQGKYWEMHNVLFQNQQALDLHHLKAHARDLKLDASVFDTCLEDGKYTAKVQQDYDDGLAAGVRGTPGFFLGKTEPDDTIQGTLITGAQPLAVFRQAIEGLLRKD